MPAVRMITIAKVSPDTEALRMQLAREAFPALLANWDGAGIPRADPLYVLICKPGELGKSPAHAVHQADQAEAMAENDPSGEPVEIILTDNPATGAAEKFLAARFNEKSFGD